jgi:A/G-specific adenine glycosylase
MDLASSICVPRAPACLICPIQACCEAFELGKQAELPVQKPKAAIPHYTVTAAVIHRDGLVLIARRPANGLLGGMWEFPGGKVEPGEELSQALKREIREELAAEIQVNGEIGIFQHGYTHFKVTLHAFHCRLAKNEPEALEASEIRWVSPGQFAEFPMGKIDRMIAHQLIKEQEG